MNALTWTDVPALIEWLVRATWQSAGLAILVLLLQLLFGRWIAPRWRFAMWLLVLVRLALPTQVGVPWRSTSIDRPAVLGLVHETPTVPASPWIIRTGVGPVPETLAVAPVIAAPVSTRSAWPGVIAVWFAVTGVIVLLILLRHARFAMKLRRDSAGIDERVVQLLRDTSGARRMPRVLLTDLVASPAVFGVFRPCILLPRGIGETASDEALRFVFLHEMAHLRRFDPQVEFLGALVCALHWFNPFAWVALQRLRSERELACDETVLRDTCEESRAEYGHVLLSLATAVRPSSPVLSMASSSTLLKGRIMRIAKYDGRSRRGVLSALMFVLLATLVATDAKSADAVAPAPPAGSPPATAPAPSITPAPADAARNAATRQKLQKRIPELRLEKVAFGDVVDFLHDTTGIDFFVNWRELEDAGIGRDTPITLRVRDITAGKAISFVLDGASGKKSKLMYTVDEGVLVISTVEDLSKNVETRVYDIRDLLAVRADAQPADNAAQNLANEKELMRLRGALLDVRTELADPSRGAEHPSTRQLKERSDAISQQIAALEAQIAKDGKAASSTPAQMVEEITSLITQTIEPNSWKENGGQVASIREMSGQLIVTQTPDAHAQLERLLSLLRQGRALQVSVEARFITIEAARIPESTLKSRIEKLEKGDGAKHEVWYLTDAEVATLLAEVKAIPESAQVSAPRLTVFNGQRAFVQVVTQQSYVSDVRRGEGDRKWEVVPDVVEEGVYLDVTATASADRKSVTMSVHPKVMKVVRLEPVPTTLPADAPAGVKIQQPVVRTHELSTTASVPDGGTLVLAGLADPYDSDKRSRVLLLLINGKIIARTGNAAPTTAPAD